MAKRRGEVYISETSSSSSNSSDISGFGDLSTSDEEYMRIIGGDDDDDDGESNDNVHGKQVILTSSLENDQAGLIRRVESIEQNLAQTNNKLDLILQLLERKDAEKDLLRDQML